MQIKSCGDEELKRIVKMESALRIINTLASFAGNESDTTAWRIIAAIQKEAKEALQ